MSIRSPLILILLATACASSARVRRDDRPAPTLPDVVELSKLAPDAALWPAGSRRVVTVFTQSPDDPTHFRAFIVDVDAGTIAWHLDGRTRIDDADLIARVADQAAKKSDPSVEIYNGGAGYTGVKPPPPPDGPGGDHPRMARWVVDLGRKTADVSARAFAVR